MRPTVRAFNSMAASLEQALHEAPHPPDATREPGRDQRRAVPDAAARLPPGADRGGVRAHRENRLGGLPARGRRRARGGGQRSTWGSDMPVRPRLKIGESLAGTVAATGRPLLPARSRPPIPACCPSTRRPCGGWANQGLLTVPARIGDRVVGVLSFLTRREEGFNHRGPRHRERLRVARGDRPREQPTAPRVPAAYEELEHTQGQLEQAQKMDAMRPARGRSRARLQQPPDPSSSGATDILLHQLKAEDPLRQRHRADPAYRRPRRRADQAAPRVQSQAGARGGRPRPRRVDRRHEGDCSRCSSGRTSRS